MPTSVSFAITVLGLLLAGLALTFGAVLGGPAGAALILVGGVAGVAIAVAPWLPQF